ncbi:MAG: phenylalanine--tRNA ligase subunit beta [Candidatus Aminicenantes bacterium]|nr:phenylalanine--tRNA ligase subunit beta [Candidatus Aminicenantes bacterium]MDH5386170.1 phenylalanine--tRNA ligase subunit beta [Candidatus Aminicenantes bacterium]MDH5742369.1 phenylalanine--tRNA ligase subunit beta [Candidatus Aminicenantes bacterium]
MKVSLNWLKDYVDIDLSIDRLVELLDNIGLLIEEKEEKDGDVILDVETYANRPDTLGHMGVARELAAALGLPLKEQSWSFNELSEKTSDLIDVQIWDEDLCPRYCGVIVRNVKVESSPQWLAKKIEAMGLKPVNSVVDVTNYVLFSTAQPIHAFDLAKIAGRKIIIRRAKKGERLLSLEGKDIDLSTEMLVIADEKKPVALAGVIGGEDSAVSESTRDVFIESAYFKPVSVRKTSKDTGIQTDASYRFERGADISFPPEAARMAASLLTQFGGKVCQGIVDVYPKPPKIKTVMLRNHRVTSLLGVEVNDSFIEKILSNLDFKLEALQPGIWKIKIPFFRVDIEREADLIEEIARFYGYEKIPVQIPPLRTLEPILDPKKEKTNKLRQLLFHFGFDEVVNFSFMDPEKGHKFFSGSKPIQLRNPISTKAAQLRTTLIGGLLDNIAWNRNRGAEGVHIFEMGNIFYWEEDEHREQLMLALAMMGEVSEKHWKEKNRETDFFHIKGTCEALMTQLRYGPFSFQEETHVHFQEGHSLALLVKGETIGYLGLLKQEILDMYLLKEKVWAVEINLSQLFDKQTQSFQFTPVVKYPSVNRDISFIGDKSVSFEEIRDAVEKLQLPHLEKFSLYDRFSGSTVPGDKVSLSLRFIFRNPERTLHADEVDALQEKIIASLGARFNFQLRKGGKIDK